MKILVAVDGSPNSLRAVKYAIKLANELRYESSITLINVHDDIPLNLVKRFTGKKAVHEYLTEISYKELKPSLRALNLSAIKHNAIIEFGHIATTICTTLKKERFDLLIVGAKGRSSIADLALGSVSQRLVTLARSPVLLVK
jgi:nucleotide-binding universal stress UspA family protein